MDETAEVTPMQAGNETAKLQRTGQRKARENPTGIKYTCFRADLRIVPMLQSTKYVIRTPAASSRRRYQCESHFAMVVVCELHCDLRPRKGQVRVSTMSLRLASVVKH